MLLLETVLITNGQFLVEVVFEFEQCVQALLTKSTSHSSRNNCPNRLKRFVPWLISVRPSCASIQVKVANKKSSIIMPQLRMIWKTSYILLSICSFRLWFFRTSFSLRSFIIFLVNKFDWLIDRTMASFVQCTHRVRAFRRFVVVLSLFPIAFEILYIG